MTATAVGGSFRDPHGVVFERDGRLLRHVNVAHAADYDALMGSGLYDELTSDGLLVPHEEVDPGLALGDGAYRVLAPERVATISYPYEWCFGQLQDAALLTLEVQRRAMDHGMSLRDASAYNVQFHGGRPVLIDTLSFGVAEEGRPWVAYRQFCEHFLAPLALAAHRDVRLLQLLRTNLGGIPLDLASSLLPRLTLLRPGLGLHIGLHARGQRRFAGRSASEAEGRVSERSVRGIVESLTAAVDKLTWEPEGTWADYYEGDSYTEAGLAHKRELVASFVDAAAPSTVWDLGGNTGEYSRIATAAGASAVCFDGDPATVELNWRRVREQGETDLLPLVADLANPSPSLGWHHRERDSMVGRGPVDLVLALALVHHLAIGNNVPLGQVAAFMADLGGELVVEFVPKSDPKVQLLLAAREDVFDAYTVDGFEAAFSAHFDIVAREAIRESDRVLYRMRAT